MMLLMLLYGVNRPLEALVVLVVAGNPPGAALRGAAAPAPTPRLDMMLLMLLLDPTARNSVTVPLRSRISRSFSVSLQLLQLPDQFIIVGVLPQPHDLLLSSVGSLLGPGQFVLQLGYLHLQLLDAGRVNRLLGSGQLGLDGLLLVLPLGLELHLVVRAGLLLLGQLLLQAGDGLLLPGPGADQRVDAGL